MLCTFTGTLPRSVEIPAINKRIVRPNKPIQGVFCIANIPTRALIHTQTHDLLRHSHIHRTPLLSSPYTFCFSQKMTTGRLIFQRIQT